MAFLVDLLGALVCACIVRMRSLASSASIMPVES